MKWKLLNIFIYQAIWFLCVLGGSGGAVAGLILVLLHLSFSPCRAADLRMVFVFLAVGSLVDGGLQFFGILEFVEPARPIPLWLAVIWMGLALLIHHSLAWMKGRYLLCMLFGAIGGPLAYAGGVAFGAASYGVGKYQALAMIGGIWCGLWPWLMNLATDKQSSVKSMQEVGS